MVLLYYLSQWLTLALEVYPHLGLPPEWTQRGNWVQKLDHHLWQMLFAFAVIFGLSRGRWREWGLNFRNAGESWRLLRKFCLVYGLYFVGIGFIVQLLFFPRPDAPYPLSPANVLGMLAFMGLVSGLSEEILFRGMMQTYLQRFFTGVWTRGGLELPVAGFVTAIIFTFAHIGFRPLPFEITHLYLPQLALAFVLGLYYAFAYHRTGSLLNPILAHNFSNGTLYLSSLLLLWLK